MNEGVPLERGRQKEIRPKSRYFAAVGSYSVKTVADRYRHADYHNKHSRPPTGFLDLSTSTGDDGLERS